MLNHCFSSWSLIGFSFRDTKLSVELDIHSTDDSICTRDGGEHRTAGAAAQGLQKYFKSFRTSS